MKINKKFLNIYEDLEIINVPFSWNQWALQNHFKNQQNIFNDYQESIISQFLWSKKLNKDILYSINQNMIEILASIKPLQKPKRKKRKLFLILIPWFFLKWPVFKFIRLAGGGIKLQLKFSHTLIEKLIIFHLNYNALIY